MATAQNKALVEGHLRNLRLTLNQAIVLVNGVTGGSQDLAEVGGNMRNIRLTLNSTILAFNASQGTSLRLAQIGGNLRNIRLTLNEMIDALNTALMDRYFITLDPVLDSYCLLSAPVVFMGDFEVEVEFSTTVSSGFPALLSTEDSDNGHVLYVIGSSGTLTLQSDDTVTTVFTQPAGVVNDGVLHTAKIRREGSTYYVSVDGGAEASSTLAGVPTDAIIIGAKKTAGALGTYFDGILANVVFTDLSGAEPVTTTFVLGEGTGNTENSVEGNNTLTYVNIPESNRELFSMSNGDWIGEELVDIDNPDSADPAWTNNLDGSWTLVGDGSGENLKFVANADQPYQMQVSFGLESLTGNGIGVQSSGTNDFTTEGNHVATVLASDVQLFKRNSGIVTATIVDPSLKRLIEVA